MKKTFLYLLLCLMATSAACSKSRPKNKAAQPAASLSENEGPRATTGRVEMTTIADPGPGQSLYVAYIRNQDNLPIARARVMILTEEPDGLYMREPRRKTVAYEYRTPLHGRFAGMIESDDKPKYLWVGGEGFQPHIYALPAATSGKRHEMTCPVTILPIAHLVFEDAQGMRVTNGIITLKPVAGTANARGRSDNYGTTQRCDDLGEVKFTRPKGKYTLIATKANGTCRLTTTFDFDGTREKKHFKLPAKSPGK